MKAKKDLVIFLVFVASFFLINLVLVLSGSLKLDWNGLGIMVAAGLTIGLYSFLYHDNPLFKMAEHIYVGVATAYLFVVDWYQVFLPDIFSALAKLWREPFSSLSFWKMIAIIIPVTLGLLVYTRLHSRLAWMSRITFSIMIGFGAGIAIPNLINAYILKQAQPTMVALWTSAGGLDWNGLVIFVGVIATLIYFFFSFEHKGPVGWIAKLGIWFMMVSFGASFGYTVMARISLLIERVNFMFKDWIPLIQQQL